MMEDHEFCDSCPGCRPLLINLTTGKPYSNSEPEMMAINKYWDNETTFAQRRAYIEVTLKNSQATHDQKLFKEVVREIQRVLS